MTRKATADECMEKAQAHFDAAACLKRMPGKFHEQLAWDLERRGRKWIQRAVSRERGRAEGVTRGEERGPGKG